MRISFEPYELLDLEKGLTIHHPRHGWPVWTPVLGIRVWFKVRCSIPFWKSLSPIYKRFTETFRDQLDWQQGFSSSRISRLKPGDSAPALPTQDVSSWELHVRGYGREKLQSFRCSFRTAATNDFNGWLSGRVYMAVPLDRFVHSPAVVQALIDDLAQLYGLTVGFAGVCGAGTPDYQSSWRAPEYFILQNYLGIDPSEDASLNMGKDAVDGYSHAGQWISLLGPAALDRLGGMELTTAKATALGLATTCHEKVLKLQTGEIPDIGYRAVPEQYRAADGILSRNRGDQYFAGHGFEAYGSDTFGAQTNVATRWMQRLEAGSAWVAASKPMLGIEVGQKPWGEPEIVPIWS